MSETRGPKPISAIDRLLSWLFASKPLALNLHAGTVTVLDRVFSGPLACKATFARTHAVYIGYAASDGLITTQLADGSFGTAWRLTDKGYRALLGHYEVA